MACSDSELSSQTMDPLRHFGRISWMRDRRISTLQPTQRSTTQKKANTHIHALSWIRTHDSNVREVEDIDRAPTGTGKYLIFMDIINASY
jgi:hypothetical protein